MLSFCALCNRLVDGQDQQVAPSAVAEFRAGVRPCSPPLTEHIISLIAQGLVWHLSPSVTGEEPQEREGTSSRITCVSSLSQALHPSVHHTLSTQPHSLVAHQTLWADEESFAAVMAFANYRRSVCAPTRAYMGRPVCAPTRANMGGCDQGPPKLKTLTRLRVLRV